MRLPFRRGNPRSPEEPEGTGRAGLLDPAAPAEDTEKALGYEMTRMLGIIIVLYPVILGLEAF